MDLASLSPGGGDEGTEGGRVDLFNDPENPQSYDLLTLVEGVTFEDGADNATLFVPSGGSSGIKVLLAGDLEAVEGETTTLTVYFDVDQNFVIQGDHGPGGVRRILFTPVLRELERNRS